LLNKFIYVLMLLDENKFLSKIHVILHHLYLAKIILLDGDLGLLSLIHIIVNVMKGL